MDYIISNGELYHHGVKGQRWGVRRFQNKDGSLTKAGRKKYDSSEKTSGKKKAQESSEKLERRKQRGKRILKTALIVGGAVTVGAAASVGAYVLNKKGRQTADGSPFNKAKKMTKDDYKNFEDIGFSTYRDRGSEYLGSIFRSY